MAVVNLDTAARLDIICRKGDSFSLAVEFDSNLPDDSEGNNNDVWTLTIREAVDSEDASLENFTVDVNDSDPKKLDITNTSSNMAGINAGLYVYDVQYSDGETPPQITTYLYGTFEVREDVTNNS
jgi:hypothetical protein